VKYEGGDALLTTTTRLAERFAKASPSPLRRCPTSLVPDKQLAPPLPLTRSLRVERFMIAVSFALGLFSFSVTAPVVCLSRSTFPGLI
jgi:hypothetical protein